MSGANSIYRFFAHSGPEREKTPAGILKETKIPGEFDRSMGARSIWHLMQVCDFPAITANMGLDSTDDGFCQQEDRGRWMVEGVTDLGKCDGVMITGACDETT